MKRFVEGTDRSQSVLFPEHLDDYIAEDDIVRIVKAFIAALDLKALDFADAEPARTGRRSYHPAVLLRIYIYIYGYLNCIQSSRRLDALTEKVVGAMIESASLSEHNNELEISLSTGYMLASVSSDNETDWDVWLN